MWSLTSPRAKRISGPKKFRSSAKEDFFNTIGTSRTRRDVGVESAMRRWSQPAKPWQGGSRKWMRPLRQRNGSRVIVSPPRETDGGVFYVKTQIGWPSGAVTLSTGDS